MRLEVVEQVERVGEARRRQQQRERVGLLLPVKAIDAVSQAAQRDRVLSPQQLQTFRLEPEELVQPAQPLAAKLELAFQRLELERDIADSLCERADLRRRRLHLRTKRRLPGLGLGHLLAERGDLRVHRLLALDDRVRTGGRSGDHGEHEHESRTADHAAGFAGRRATPAKKEQGTVTVTVPCRF